MYENQAGALKRYMYYFCLETTFSRDLKEEDKPHWFRFIKAFFKLKKSRLQANILDVILKDSQVQTESYL